MASFSRLAKLISCWLTLVSEVVFFSIGPFYFVFWFTWEPSIDALLIPIHRCVIKMVGLSGIMISFMSSLYFLRYTLLKVWLSGLRGPCPFPLSWYYMSCWWSKSIFGIVAPNLPPILSLSSLKLKKLVECISPYIFYLYPFPLFGLYLQKSSDVCFPKFYIWLAQTLFLLNNIS